MNLLQRSTALLSPFGSSQRPIFLEVRSSTWFITGAIATAIFTDIFLYAVIVPVFPFSLPTRAGIPEADVQHWISVLLAVYGAGLLAGSPVCGFFADRVKYRKAPLLIGLFAATGSTVMLCVARSIPVLVVGRLLQGLSASIVWVVGLALLADTVGKNQVAKALGYVGLALSLGTLLAPLLGGIVYRRAGYYGVFAMSFGVIILDIFLRLTLIEKKQARKWLEPDLGSELHVASPALAAEDKAMSPGTPTRDFHVQGGDKEMNVSRGGEQAQQRAQQPREPRPKRRMPAILTLWTSRRMFAAFWGNLMISIMLCGLDTTLTLFVSRTFQWTSLQAGLVYLALLLPTFFTPVFGAFVDKFGARWIAASGFLVMVPPWVLLRLVDHHSVRQVVLLCALLALIGLGCAMAFSGLTAEFSKICDLKEARNPGLYGPHGAYAQAYGIFNIAWAAGSLIGAFWSGGVYNAAGWGTMVWTMALLAGVAVIPVLLFTDGWIGKAYREDE